MFASGASFAPNHSAQPHHHYPGSHQKVAGVSAAAGSALSPESALATAAFDQFNTASTFKSVLHHYRHMCDSLRLRPQNIRHFYPKLKSKVRTWKSQALWSKFDKRASHKSYNHGKACSNVKVLIIGAGPCGLRSAIEAQLLGAKVVVVEKRDRFSRNNVLHLWPFVIADLKALGAKKFYGKFCAGAIDHISIRQLQCILLKVALLLGVEVFEGVSFEELLDPPEDQSQKIGYHARFSPAEHPVNQYEFDALFGADGKRNTLSGFRRKEFRGKLAIAITANFINKHSEMEARVQEISGVAFIFNQKFFKDLYAETGIDLENIVYYKDETHYFVMTAKKHSLIDKGVILRDLPDTQQLLHPSNVDRVALCDYAREAADFSTGYLMPSLDFAVNHYGKPDIAMFDFTSMFAAENASRVVRKRGHQLLQCLVGDSLLEPFWPTGSGCARGFLSSFDACWALRSWASGLLSPLQVIAERESIYRLLAQTTPENLVKNSSAYMLEPASRYPTLNLRVLFPYQVRHLFETDEPEPVNGQMGDMPDAAQGLEHEQMQADEASRKRKRRDSIIQPDTLLSWYQKQVAHIKDLNVFDLTNSLKSGRVLCTILHRYRPDLIDLDRVSSNDAARNCQSALDIIEREFGIPPVMAGTALCALNGSGPSTELFCYLTQLHDALRGEIPHSMNARLPLKVLKGQSLEGLDLADFPDHLKETEAELNASSPLRQNNTNAGRVSCRILKDDKPELASSSDVQKNKKRKNTTGKMDSEEENFELDEKGDAIEATWQDTAPDDFGEKVRSLEDKFRGIAPAANRQKPKDLVRAIGRIEKTDWNLSAIEKKIEENPKVVASKGNKERVPRWSKDTYNEKFHNIERRLRENGEDEERIAKYLDIDASLKRLERKLREGSTLDTGLRGHNKVSNLANQLSNKFERKDPSETAAQLLKNNSNVKQNRAMVLPSSGTDLCYFCCTRVYLVERLNAEGKFFHRQCFKCGYCAASLRLGNYIYDRDNRYGGQFFCIPHFGMSRGDKGATKPDQSKTNDKNQQQMQQQQEKQHQPQRSLSSSAIFSKNARPSTSPSAKPAASPSAQASSLLSPSASIRSPASIALAGDRGTTPERVEFENSVVEASDEGEFLSEEEWTDRNFGTSANELDDDDDDDDDDDTSQYSDLSDDEVDDNVAALDSSSQMTAEQTRRLAENWKRRYSKEANIDDESDDSEDSDVNGDDLSGHGADGDESHTATEGETGEGGDDDDEDEGEAGRRARELRKQELNIIVHAPPKGETSESGSETEVGSDDESDTQIDTDSEFAADDVATSRRTGSKRPQKRALKAPQIPTIVIDGTEDRQRHLSSSSSSESSSSDTMEDLPTGKVQKKTSSSNNKKQNNGMKDYIAQVIDMGNDKENEKKAQNEPNPRMEQLKRLLQRTESTEAVCARRGMLRRQYLLGSPSTQPQKSVSTADLGNRFKSFMDKISETQKKLNPAPEPSPAMQAFLGKSPRLEDGNVETGDTILSTKDVSNITQPASSSTSSLSSLDGDEAIRLTNSPPKSELLISPPAKTEKGAIDSEQCEKEGKVREEGIKINLKEKQETKSNTQGNVSEEQSKKEDVQRRNAEQLLREEQERLQRQKIEQLKKDIEEKQRKEAAEKLKNEMKEKEAKLLKRKDEIKKEQQEKERKLNEEKLRKENEEKLRIEQEILKKEQTEKLKKDHDDKLRKDHEEKLKKNHEEKLRKEKEEKLREEREEKLRQEQEERLKKKQLEKLKKDHEEKLKREHEEQMRMEQEEKLIKEQEKINKEQAEKLRMEREEMLRKEREENLRKEQEEERLKKEEERLRKEHEDKFRKQREERIQKEAEEKLRKEQEKLKEEKLKKEQADKLKREQEDKLRKQNEEKLRIEMERLRKEQEEKLRKEQEEKLRKEQEEKLRKQNEEKLRIENEKIEREIVKKELEEKRRKENEEKRRLEEIDRRKKELLEKIIRNNEKRKSLEVERRLEELDSSFSTSFSDSEEDDAEMTKKEELFGRVEAVNTALLKRLRREPIGAEEPMEAKTKNLIEVSEREECFNKETIEDDFDRLAENAFQEIAQNKERFDQEFPEFLENVHISGTSKDEINYNFKDVKKETGESSQRIDSATPASLSSTLTLTELQNESGFKSLTDTSSTATLVRRPFDLPLKRTTTSQGSTVASLLPSPNIISPDAAMTEAELSDWADDVIDKIDFCDDLAIESRPSSACKEDALAPPLHKDVSSLAPSIARMASLESLGDSDSAISVGPSGVATTVASSLLNVTPFAASNAALEFADSDSEEEAHLNSFKYKHIRSTKPVLPSTQKPFSYKDSALSSKTFEAFTAPERSHSADLSTKMLKDRSSLKTGMKKANLDTDSSSGSDSSDSEESYSDTPNKMSKAYSNGPIAAQSVLPSGLEKRIMLRNDSLLKAVGADLEYDTNDATEQMSVPLKPSGKNTIVEEPINTNDLLSYATNTTPSLEMAEKSPRSSRYEGYIPRFKDRTSTPFAHVRDSLDIHLRSGPQKPLFTPSREDIIARHRNQAIDHSASEPHLVLPVSPTSSTSPTPPQVTSPSGRARLSRNARDGDLVKDMVMSRVVSRRGSGEKARRASPGTVPFGSESALEAISSLRQNDASSVMTETSADNHLTQASSMSQLASQPTRMTPSPSLSPRNALPATPLTHPERFSLKEETLRKELFASSPQLYQSISPPPLATPVTSSRVKPAQEVVRSSRNPDERLRELLQECKRKDTAEVRLRTNKCAIVSGCLDEYRSKRSSAPVSAPFYPPPPPSDPITIKKKTLADTHISQTRAHLGLSRTQSQRPSPSQMESMQIFSAPSGKSSCDSSVAPPLVSVAAPSVPVVSLPAPSVVPQPSASTNSDQPQKRTVRKPKDRERRRSLIQVVAGMFSKSDKSDDKKKEPSQDRTAELKDAKEISKEATSSKFLTAIAKGPVKSFSSSALGGGATSVPKSPSMRERFSKLRLSRSKDKKKTGLEPTNRSWSAEGSSSMTTPSSPLQALSLPTSPSRPIFSFLSSVSASANNDKGKAIPAPSGVSASSYCGPRFNPSCIKEENNSEDESAAAASIEAAKESPSAASTPSMRRQKAALRAAKQAEQKRLRMAQEIQRQMEECEVKTRELEERGIAVEKALIGETKCTDGSCLEEDELMREWFGLVREKNKLVRWQEELEVKKKELQLEDRHVRLEGELRQRMTAAEREKSRDDIDREGKILAEMISILEQKDSLTALLDHDRQRYLEEDQDLDQLHARKVTQPPTTVFERETGV